MKRLTSCALAGAMMISISTFAVESSCEKNCVDKKVQTLQTQRLTGDLEATMRLGVAYWMGYGVNRDIDKAFKYIYEAAEKSHPRSMMLLSKMYERGIGTNVDLAKAEHLYNKAKIAIHSEKELIKLSTIKPGKGTYRPYRSYQGRIIPKSAPAY